MAFKYAGGPYRPISMPIASGEDIGPQEAVYFSSNQYIGQAVDDCKACGVSVNDAEAATSDGSEWTLILNDPETLFWADVGNGTILATDVGGKCDIYDHNGIDVDSSTTGNVFILEVDTTNNRALIKIAFNEAFATGLS